MEHLQHAFDLQRQDLLVPNAEQRRTWLSQLWSAIYSHQEALVEAFERIRTKLGGQHTNEAIAHVEAGDLASAARIALVYYDKTYRHGLDQRDAKTVDGRGCKPDDIAQKCMVVHNDWNPWNLKSN